MNQFPKAIKLFLFVAILLVSFNTNAQSYHKMLADSNRWNVGRDDVGFDGGNNWSTRVYRSYGDTTIDSVKYKFFSTSIDSYTVNTPFKFIREDTIKKQIFCRIDKDSMDIVIYDFSLKDGDSTTITFDQGDKIRYKVSRTNHGVGDTFNLAADSGNKYFIAPEHLTWIEGIGCTSSFVYPFERYAVDGYYAELLCSYRNGVRTYSNPDGLSCNLFEGVDLAKESINKISIYPNPSNGKYSISFSKIFSGEVLVYDMMGNLKCGRMANNANKVDLELSVPSGIYLLKLNDGISIYTQKLIKN